MTSKSVLIGKRAFESKKSATESIRAILYKYPVGEKVRGDDMWFLFDLLELHQQADEKIGCGVVSIEIEQNGPTRGFWLTRVDGTRTDWSFVACLSPPSPERQALSGFRTAVVPQILAFRDEFFRDRIGATCPITGEVVTLDNCHVDHESPTFRELVTEFLSCQYTELREVAVVPTRDGDTKTRLLSPELESNWQRFHQLKAKLRIVSMRANLSILRRQ
jgi:hypothetical protein